MARYRILEGNTENHTVSSTRSCLLSLPAVAICLLLGTPPAGAGTPPLSPAPTPPASCIEHWFSQDYMLGDWGGLRTDLADHGAEFEFFYLGSLPSNLSGGIREGSVYQHALLLALDLDTAKLGLWKGGHLHASGVWLEGDPFSETYVGDLNKTNLVDFPAAFRLWELTFEQRFFDDTLAIKAGLMSVDRDFIVPELYNSLSSINFLNQTFFFPTLAFNLYDIPGFPPGSHALPSTPYSSLGALIKWQPIEQFYMQAAVYDGNPDLGPSGTRWDLSRDQGALLYYELGLRVNQGTDSTGLPGSYKIGGWYHTDDFFDVYDTIASAFRLTRGPTTHGGNYGGYFLAEQTLYREASAKNDPAAQGLVGFFRLSAAPSDRNLTQFGVDGGFVYKGLVPSRDYDTLGLAFSYLQMSNDIRRAQRDANRVAPGTFVVADYEGVVELNYKLQLAAWWTLQPSLQYVIHPGGSKAIADAWVLGVQTTLRF